jgi:hypothetical protein
VAGNQAQEGGVNFDAVDFVEYFNLTADNWQMINLWNTSVNLFTPHIQTVLVENALDFPQTGSKSELAPSFTINELSNQKNIANRRRRQLRRSSPPSCTSGSNARATNACD